MSESKIESLLAKLSARKNPNENAAAWKEVAASAPEPAPQQNTAETNPKEEKLAGLISRINGITKQSSEPSIDSGEAVSTTSVVAQATDLQEGEYIPMEPESYREAGLTDSEVESLILKYLLGRGDASGRDIADQIKLPFVLIEHTVRKMKDDRLLAYKSSAAMNDYVCQLADIGRERARRHVEHCTYFGSAPVALDQYIGSVRAQSLEGLQPSEEELRDAFKDLLINPKLFAKLGPAINSGRGMFLYGYPGNGKTSIAERVTQAFGQYIWIPRALGIDGEIMRLFDPMNHEEVPLKKTVGYLDQSKIDQRWVRIRRPTIVAGGELTMDNLEVTLNTATGINEAPLQLKSNCGTLVIDDFGRQRMSVDELLNRWIVPLEKRYDFLNLTNGKKIQVPFDQLIVFSTNLEPRDLVDEAFLRRIPYKIEITDPPEDDFRQLFQILCPKMGFQLDSAVLDYLIDTHYKAVDRPFRCCQPRDLLLQVRNHCLYEKKALELTPSAFDFAVENYFSVM